MSLNQTELMSLENDIKAIRSAGGIKDYVEKRSRQDNYLIWKLEKLLDELKKAEEDGKE